MEKKPYPSEMQERFIVRLPDGMRDRIADAAKAAGRSMNAEIVARLQSTFKPEQAKLDFGPASVEEESRPISKKELLQVLNEFVASNDGEVKFKAKVVQDEKPAQKKQKVNKIILVGDLGRAPDIRYRPAGEPVEPKAARVSQPRVKSSRPPKSLGPSKKR